MWLGFLDQKEDFECLEKQFSASTGIEYETGKTPFGNPYMVPKEQEKGPGFILLNQETAHNIECYRWAYKNLHSDTFVSTGSLWTTSRFVKKKKQLDEDQQAEVEARKDYDLMIPKSCMRLGGSFVTESGGLLYEKLDFDQALQESFCEKLSTRFNFPEDCGPLIGAPDYFESARVEKVMRESLGASGWDDFSGDMLVFAQSLNIRAGCLKLYPDPRRKSSLLLCELWKTLLEEAPLGSGS